MDRTQRVAEPRAAAPARAEPRVITLPPKRRVNMALAAIAGALLILVIVVGHDTLSRTAAATPAPSLHSAPTTVTPTVPTPAAPAPAKGGTKGKGHD